MKPEITRPTVSFGDIRKGLAHLHKKSKDQLSDPEFYRLDRNSAYDYMRGLPEWIDLVRQYFAEIKARGEKVVYVDVCGRADARCWGADINYSFSTQPTDKHYFRDKRNICVVGNIFNSKDVGAFVNTLRGRGHRPALVTFEPCAGLQPFTPTDNEVTGIIYRTTFQRLENNLRRMVSIMSPGGYVWIEQPFQLLHIADFFRGTPKKESPTCLGLESFAKKNKCSIRIDLITNPRILLRSRRRK